MDSRPLVSVILPVYNGEDFVGCALDSALSQTWQNIEIVAVDDGSKDGSLKVLESYASRDARVRVLAQANAGVARARNRAISESRGDFIAPLDADDLWAPNKIERQMETILLGESRTGLVYSWWVWIDEGGVVLDRSPRWQIQGNVFEKLIQINFTGNASVPLFRKALLEEAGGYDESLAASRAGGCEDWDIALRIAARYEVAVVPEILLGYRRRPGSMSSAYEAMMRSQQRVMQSMQALRPDVAPLVFQRSSEQFAMYLAGLAFWAGDFRKACGWGLKSGWRLAYRVAPHLFRILFAGVRSTPTGKLMLPGIPLDVSGLPEPLIPYDRIYMELNPLR